MSGELKWRNLL